ncbi:hypothetical protein [Qipengyuania huizhouensis]|uniref:hypothetical protein n=1 Tax=Qipengyuania huizhouensis TaxID=2867245 RepID=UPI001C871C28|nr:hypothetical protein [Qipengyuania huizhouensis]MBX7459676.1 hypothetical protein [Qipengyuania huizhouensis]
MTTSVKLALFSIALHFGAMAFAWIAKPEYDGGDLSALIFWIYISHIFLIIGGLILLFHLVRWFVTRKNDGF